MAESLPTSAHAVWGIVLPEPSLFMFSQAFKKLLRSYCGQHTPEHSEPLQLPVDSKVQVIVGWTSLKF